MGKELTSQISNLFYVKLTITLFSMHKDLTKHTATAAPTENLEISQNPEESISTLNDEAPIKRSFDSFDAKKTGLR